MKNRTGSRTGCCTGCRGSCHMRRCHSSRMRLLIAACSAPGAEPCQLVCVRTLAGRVIEYSRVSLIQAADCACMPFTLTRTEHGRDLIAQGTKYGQP